MKLLKLGDWHFGVKQDDPWVQNIQRQGIRQAIALSKDRGIKVWLQAGDVFDVRKAITHKTMQFAREMFTEIAEAGIHTYIIVGNHDMNYKDKIHPNACTELLGKLSSVTVIDTPRVLTFDGLNIDMIPWICDENHEDIMNFISESTSKYCMGHFELNGFYFYKGLKSHGTEPDFLKAYTQAWSGHFHTISENRNIVYIGTPWTLTAGDENDPRGFWIFDTETEKSTFHQNDVMWHRKVHYPTSVNPLVYKDLSVRVIVEREDENLVEFETALEAVVHEVKIINRVEHSVDIDENADIDIKTLPDLMDGYLETLGFEDSDTKSLKHMAKSLYLEASK